MVLLLALCLVLGLSPLDAKTQNTIEQADIEMLFHSYDAADFAHLNVMLLSDEEMQNTQGEAWWTPILYGVLKGGAIWSYNCFIKKVVGIGK
uniref:Uncharacterized protein n=1 Tax=uncultured Helicobacter sp. TaxID=175537 RepID=A0A650EL70_9HELI|nr:hypothetical protein Helico4rc_1210 [uncultured Helicobacter sp.]